MAKKTIKVKLSQSSIQDAIRQIEEYKRRLNSKVEQFLQALADEGITVIDEAIAEREGDADTSHSIVFRINRYGYTCTGTLIVNGAAIAFLEFGAGVHYNGAAGSSPHPMGAEMGMTIGSYGKGEGKRNRWRYTSPNGETGIISYGTKAAMPMYKASVEIQQKVQAIAKQVFGGA